MSVLGILVVAGIILLPVLLPGAVTDNGIMSHTTSSNTFNELDKLSMGNITVRHEFPGFFPPPSS